MKLLNGLYEGICWRPAMFKAVILLSLHISEAEYPS
jgi:hypothetical protein